LPVVFDESDVQRLCGPTDYGRADALQRGGHVQAPSLTDGITLRGRVRGTWRRVDEVSVTVASGRLAPRCTCGAETGLCRHAGALLLHWLRDRAAFDAPQPGRYVPLAAMHQVLGEVHAITPTDELAGLLDVDTAPRLRAIARRRGVALTARTKEEVVQQLAVALAEPASVDAALAALSPAEQLALDVAHVASGFRVASEAQIATAYRAVAPAAAAPPTEALYERGLLALAMRGTGGGSNGYVVPLAVAARLPALTTLAPTEATLAAGEETSQTAAGPGIGEAFLLVARGLGTRAVALRDQEGAQPFGLARPWEAHEVAAAERSTQAAHNIYGIAEVRLRPGPLPLSSADRTALARQVGLSSRALVFALDLLALLSILEASDRLGVRAARLEALLDRPPAARLATIVAAWLARSEWSDVAGTVGQRGALEVRARTYYYSGAHLPLPPVGNLRSALAILVGRLPTGRWYDPASLVAGLRPFQQAIGLAPPPPEGQQGVWFIRRDRPRERLDPTTPDGWRAIVAPLVTALLSGPLVWLGLVDVVSRDNQLVAFRPRAAARVLARGTLPADALAADAALAVDADLTVHVPPGADLAVHSLLGRTGEVVQASGPGLAYRLTATGVRDAFDGGWTGPDLLAWLAERAAGPLPAAARQRLEGWWAHYGTLRLYDEITLIELGDDLLLRELQATTSLDKALLYTFSPRVIAVDPAAADALVAELTRQGHTPRVVESG
jgi:hypothetical protein